MTASRVSVCVFASSSEAVSPSLRTLAAELGSHIAGRGWHLVYGGGNVGLMGELARAALAATGTVTGIIPERLHTTEIALHDVTELITTQTMRERKHLMDEAADAFVVLPGGIGTLEELVEVLTLKQLGYHRRPIVLLDPEGHWDGFVEVLRTMVATRMAEPSMLELYAVARDVPGALDAAAGGV